MQRRQTLTGTVAALALLVTGCTAVSQPTVPSKTVVSTSVSASPTPAEDALSDSLDDKLQAAARERAVAVVAAWLSNHESSAAWWGGLDPLVSDGFRSTYAQVDPGRVPTGQVTGVAQLVGGTDFAVTLHVPTTVGVATVQLARLSADGGWLGTQVRVEGVK